MSQRSYSLVNINDCTDEHQGGIAPAKIKVAYEGHAAHHGLNLRGVTHIGVAPFNSTDLAYKFADFASTTPYPADVIFALNAAPPINGDGIENNIRREFVLGRLKTGSIFGGTQNALSLVRSQISELYVLTDSNNGDQFRSYKVLPEALVQFATDTINRDRLQQIDNPADDIAVRDTSLVGAVDNFENIKLILSNADRRTLHAIFNENSKAARSDQDTRQATIEISYGSAPVDLQYHQPYSNWQRVRIVRDMFEGRDNELVISLNSSSQLWDDRGNLQPVAQLARIQKSNPGGLGLRLPPAGAIVRLRP